jgi:hypothetical protein
VRDLTKDDANLFTKLCATVWWIPGAGYVPIVKDPGAPHIFALGINFASLTHLNSIGLIEFGVLGYGVATPLKSISVLYCDTTFDLHSDGGQERRFDFSRAVFTAVGLELLPISGARGNDALRDAALREWEREGWKQK